MPLFGKKKSKISPADEAFLEEMSDLANEDTELDGAFSMMEKFQDIDMDAVQKESEEMIIKVDFILFSIRKIVSLLEKTLDNPFDYEENVKKLVDETEEEYHKRVKQIYEDNK